MRIKKKFLCQSSQVAKSSRHEVNWHIGLVTWHCTGGLVKLASLLLYTKAKMGMVALRLDDWVSPSGTYKNHVCIGKKTSWPSNEWWFPLWGKTSSKESENCSIREGWVERPNNEPNTVVFFTDGLRMESFSIAGFYCSELGLIESVLLGQYTTVSSAEFDVSDSRAVLLSSAENVKNGLTLGTWALWHCG